MRSADVAAAALVFCLSSAATGIAFEFTPRLAAASQSDCVRGAPAPLLVAKSGNARPEFRRTNGTEAVETLRIDSRTDLTIRHFGCAHFALEFTFVTRVGGRESPAAWLSRAARWLRTLPVDPDQQRFVGHITQRLQQAATERYAFGTPLQISETATLTVDLHRSRAGNRLVLLYEVVL